jgi:predicted nucleic acid-binding Zn ribbon protein
MVEPVLAERCRPTMIKEGVLIVATPSGIFAEQIRLRDAEILRLCLAVAPGSMHSVRAVVE